MRTGEPLLSWGLVLPFDTDDPQFTRGVEIGIVFSELGSLTLMATRYERLIHTSNLEMVMRIAEALHWSLRAEPVSEDPALDEWSTVVMERLTTPLLDA